MKPFSALLALTLLLATPLRADENVTHFADTDPAMNAAIDQAQDTLPLFVRNAFDGDRLASPDALVKVAFEVGTDWVEVIWVEQLGKVGPNWIGRLANDPIYMDGLAYGDPVAFTTEQIYDWVYYIGDRAYGSYTTRVILEGLDTEVRAQVRATLSDRPLPPGW
ncbi:DUF2314 domain-containing protein [Roseovarius indicus]|uniref:DUF2314 domain-containing protein n=1 Tax=Roseovarius indicus TaxID=540747 RepID=UPI0007D985BA|nr:DUF2314 domain-containing protein [Roseovarius indicus]OAO10378.1 hypothetical protein A8B76_21275 [Roseovarius indicus]